MRVQIVAKLEEKFNKETQTVETIEKKINNVEYIEFDLRNDKYAISSNKQLRIFILNKDKYRLSLKSFKECRKRELIGGM